MNQPVLTDLFVVPVDASPSSRCVSGEDGGNRVVPSGEDSGHSPAPFRKGSHSSWTGARAQVHCWTEKQSALLQMLAHGQPLTRNQLALFLHWPLSSVCSVLDSVRDQIEFVDYESYRWSDTRITKRERFQVKR